MSPVVTCNACQTRLEVPEGSEGRKFRCSACKEIIVVPLIEEEETPLGEEAEVSEVVDDGDEGGRGGQESARQDHDSDEYEDEDDGEEEVDGGGDDFAGQDNDEEESSPVPPPEEKPKTGAPRLARRKPAPGGTRRLKDKTRRRIRPDKDGHGDVKASPGRLGFPFFLVGLAAAVLLLAAGGVVMGVLFLGGKKGDGEGTPTAEDERPAAVETAPEMGSDPLVSYRDLVYGAREAADWYEAGLAAKEAGLPGNATLHFLKAVRIDPEYEKAWDALGYRRYVIPEDYRMLLGAPGILSSLRPLDGRWLAPRKFIEIQAGLPAYLESERAVFEKLGERADFAEIEEVRKRIHNSTGFESRIWGDRPALPYFLFDERGKKGGKLLSPEDSAFLVDKKLNMLSKVFDFAVKRWMKPMGFEWDEKRPLVAVIFQNRASFDEFNRAIGTYLPTGAIAYFNRMTKFIYMYDAQTVGPDGQDHQDGILFHEATHQIVDAFLATGSGMARVSYWFNEGIAEYVGSVKRRYGDGDEVYWDFGAENQGRILEYWKARRPDLNARTREMEITEPYAFELREVLTACRNRWGTSRALQKKIPGKAWAAFESGGMAGSLIYAQGYFILYYAYTCGKPEYKAAMDRYLLAEFRGKGNLKNFMKAFDLSSDEDLSRFEKGMLEYHDSLVPDELKRKR